MIIDNLIDKLMKTGKVKNTIPEEYPKIGKDLTHFKLFKNATDKTIYDGVWIIGQQWKNNFNDPEGQTLTPETKLKLFTDHNLNLFLGKIRGYMGHSIISVKTQKNTLLNMLGLDYDLSFILCPYRYIYDVEYEHELFKFIHDGYFRSLMARLYSGNIEKINELEQIKLKFFTISDRHLNECLQPLMVHRKNPIASNLIKKKTTENGSFFEQTSFYNTAYSFAFLLFYSYESSNIRKFTRELIKKRFQEFCPYCQNALKHLQEHSRITNSTDPETFKKREFNYFEK